MAAKAKAPLRLGEPTTASGGRDNTLHQSIEKTYDEVQVLKSDGKPHAVIYTSKQGAKSVFPGRSELNFFYALINGAFSGKGAGPDGSCLYVAENIGTVVKAYGASFKQYQIVVTPGGRSGMKKYGATIEELLAVCKAKATIIGASEKEYGIKKTVARTGTEKEEPAAEINF